MQASIHSVDAENRSSAGKTYEVNSTDFHVEASDGFVYVVAKENELYIPPLNPFAQSLTRDITRTLRLALSPEEVKRIVDVAIAAKLMRMAVITE